MSAGSAQRNKSATKTVSLHFQFFLMSLIFFACLDFLDQPQAPAGQKHQDVENNGRTGASLHADRRSGREVRSRQTPIHEFDDD